MLLFITCLKFLVQISPVSKNVSEAWTADMTSNFLFFCSPNPLMTWAHFARSPKPLSWFADLLWWHRGKPESRNKLDWSWDEISAADDCPSLPSSKPPFWKVENFQFIQKDVHCFVCDNFFWSLLFLFLDWLFSEMIFRTAARSVKFHISFRFRVCVFLQFFFMEILQVHSTGNVELVVRFSIIYKPGKKRKFYLKKLTFKN